MSKIQEELMRKLTLGLTLRGTPLVIDLQELITGRTLLCSISRWGKSWTARRIVEQAYGIAGIVVVDVEGEYRTLKDKFPDIWTIGNGGIGGMMLVPDSAPLLAEQVLKKRASAIIDLSGPRLDMRDGQEYVGRFVKEFLVLESVYRKPYLFILEECDELCPEKGTGKSECKGEIIRLVKKGGKRGMGTVVITQRPAWTSKFVISQCANKIVGRIEWPKDLDTLREFAQIPPVLADPESKSPYALKNLAPGHFYVSGSFVERDELIKVGPVETTHLGDTPQVFSGTPTEP